MLRFLIRCLPALLCAAAGFAIARFWPTEESKPPSLLPTPAAATERPHWQGLKGAARLASCLEHCTALAPAAWPAVFARHQHDEMLRPSLIEAWIAADPAGFWQWIVEGKDAGLLTEVGLRLFAAWAKRDAAAAFAATGQIASHHLRDPLRTLVVETELARDLKAGLALVAQFGPISTNGHLNSAWIARDPLAALRGLSDLPGGVHSLRRFYLRVAAGLVAKQNPDAFLAWLETKPRDVSTPLSNYTFTGGAPMDAARVIAAVSALPPGRERDDALRGAIAIGGAQLPAEEILRLARQHFTGWERSATIGDATQYAAKFDPVRAASLLAEMPATRYVIYAARDVAGRFAKHDWNAAHDWVQSVPDPPVRREAWAAISGVIPPERLSEFAASLATLPEEELSDDLLLNTRRALQKTGPDAVGRWMDSLPQDRAAWVRQMAKID